MRTGEDAAVADDGAASLCSDASVFIFCKEYLCGCARGHLGKQYERSVCLLTAAFCSYLALAMTTGIWVTLPWLPLLFGPVRGCWSRHSTTCRQPDATCGIARGSFFFYSRERPEPTQVGSKEAIGKIEVRKSPLLV